MNNTIIRNSIYRIKYALGICLIGAMLCTLGFGQESTGGASPIALQGGGPAGTYALSNLDNVNLFNGNLNFRFPLLSIGGRGSAQHAITLPVGKKWFVEKIPLGQTGQFLYTFNDYEPGILKAGYGPGVMQGYRSGFFPQTCTLNETVTFSQTLTKLIFRTGDGTEYQFLSTNNPGVAQVQNCNPTSFNRGVTFRTIDGSGMTFIADTAIQDIPFVESVDPSQPFTVSGHLLLPDGTRFWIENGLVRWGRDRNGNRITFNYDQNARVNEIQDSLNRTVTINYGVAEGTPYGTNDQIIYKGNEGAQRIIRVSYSTLSNSLRTTQPGDPTSGQTCQDLNLNTYNPNVVSSVWLPDGRRYILFYNCFGELARVVLPTGGAFEYDHGAGLTNGAADGTFDRPAVEGGTYPQVYRRVLEKRSYPDGTTLAGKITFGRSETYNPAVFQFTSDQGFVQVDERNATGTLLKRHKHYFLGSASPSLSLAPGYVPPAPLEGREWQTEQFDTNGSTILQRVTHSWENNTAIFGQGPHITQTVTTLVDTNQVALTTFNYDQFNNRTDVYEYDFGAGTQGPFLRRSHVDYLVTNPVNQTDYTATSIYLRNLPSEQWISTDQAGSNKAAYVKYEYDNYVDDARHKPLVLRPSITGLDSAYTAFATLTRGNVTGVTSYVTASSQTGPIVQSTQYDVAGNAVANIDGMGNKTTFTFADSFCNGVTCGGSFTSNTYAFVTSTTSPVPDPSGQFGSTTALVTSTVYDFWTGRASSSTDENNNTTSFQYNDPLDRLKAVIRPAGAGRTDLEYGDTIGNLYVRTLVDLDASRRTDSYRYFDGFGRETETRSFEGGTNYISVQQQYDALGRLFKRSNPFRPWQSESAVWTTTQFDALGRVKMVTTPDNAVLNTAYSGDRVLVTDQAGKKRLSRTNALGQLKDVWEITPNDPSQYPGIEAVSFGGQSLHGFLTHYDYNVLDGLVKVTQGTQQRIFMYDSLKRLIRARNPEQATYGPISDITEPITGNSAWSVKYSYDANGNLTQKTDARGIVSTYAYDALNRNTTINYSDTTTNPDVTRTYDGATNGRGRLWASYAGGSEAVGSNVEKSLLHSFDVLGRPLVRRQSFKVNNEWKTPYEITRTYNLAGNVASQIYPSGNQVTYNYDSAGRLGDKDALNPAFKGNLGDGTDRIYSRGINYVSAGQMKQEQFGTATAVFNKLVYNSRLQLAEILASTTGGDDTWNRGKILNQFSLQCSGAACNATDNNGNLRKQEIYIPALDQVSSPTSWYQQYDYDDLNRLKRVHEYTGDVNKDWQQEYVYDRWGNRTINQNTSATFGTNIPKPNYTVDPSNNNRLVAPSGHTMTYDVAGNVLSDTYNGAGTRVYDAENRMTQANNANSLYTYNADGQRVRRKHDGVETWQIYGFDGELLAEYPANGATSTPTKEYGYRNGQLLISAAAGISSAPPVFADDFNDNSLNSINWTVMVPGSTPTVSEQSQQLQIALSPNTAGYNGVFSTSTHNLTNRMVQVEAVQSVSHAGWVENFLELELNANNYFMIQVGVGNMIFRSRVNGVNDQTIIPFDGTANRFWRIRHDQAANLVYFETSADSSVWLTRKTVTPGFSLTALRFHLLAGAYGTGNSTPGTAKYDNFKLLPSGAAPVSLTVPNGGFEAPVLGNGNWQYSPSGGSWTFAAGGGISGINSAFTGVPSAAPQGAQVAFLQATGTISQSISGFQASANYVITFSAIQRTNCCNTGGQDIGVYLDDVLIGSFHPGSTGYLEYSTQAFSTTTGTHTIKFAGLNPLGGDHTAFIDNVRITGSPKPGFGVQWLLTDQLGTPRMVFDESGTLANIKRHDYLPFGEELLSQGLRNPGLGYATADGVRQQFTQKERDIETALDYFIARYYSAAQGRFTSPDEFTGGPRELFTFADSAAANPTFYSDLTNPQSLNKYQYAYNNPLRYVDPDGHDVIGYTLLVTGPNQVPNTDRREVSNVSTLGIKDESRGGYVLLNLQVDFDKGDNVSDYKHVRAAVILDSPTGESGVVRNAGRENPGDSHMNVKGQSRFVSDNPGVTITGAPKAALSGSVSTTIFVAGEYNEKTGKLSQQVAYYGVRLVYGKDGKIDAAKSAVGQISRADFIKFAKSVGVKLPKDGNKQDCPECLLSPPGGERR